MSDIGYITHSQWPRNNTEILITFNIFSFKNGNSRRARRPAALPRLSNGNFASRGKFPLEIFAIWKIRARHDRRALSIIKRRHLARATVSFAIRGAGDFNLSKLRCTLEIFQRSLAKLARKRPAMEWCFVVRVLLV